MNQGERFEPIKRGALPTEAEVTSRWQGNGPVVSIICYTYQHGPYIEAALTGFLAQQTDFPFEVIVRDDASTDGTAETVADFAAEYPNVITAILEEQNRYHQTSAFPVVAPLSRGEFAMTAQGDDYWTDPGKLQVQVDTLRNAPFAAGCFHDLVVVDSGSRYLARYDMHRGNLSSRDWTLDPSIPSQTLMYRNWFKELPSSFPRIYNIDTYLQARLSARGGAIYVPSIRPSAYRVHEGGIWSMADVRDQAPQAATSFYWIGHWFAENGDKERAKYYLVLAAQELLESHLDFGVDPRPLSSRRSGALARSLNSILSQQAGLKEVVRKLIDKRF